MSFHKTKRAHALQPGDRVRIREPIQATDDEWVFVGKVIAVSNDPVSTVLTIAPDNGFGPEHEAITLARDTHIEVLNR